MFVTRLKIAAVRQKRIQNFAFARTVTPIAIGVFGAAGRRAHAFNVKAAIPRGTKPT